MGDLDRTHRLRSATYAKAVLSHSFWCFACRRPLGANYVTELFVLASETVASKISELARSSCSVKVDGRLD
jgi:hypothetical protein